MGYQEKYQLASVLELSYSGSEGTKDMPKQSPIPDALDKPFYDACNEERLVVQYCTNCLRYQFPPRPACTRCGSNATVEWRQLSGRGRIISRVVVHDTPTSSLIPGQPFNVAAIALDEELGGDHVVPSPRDPRGSSTDRGCGRGDL